MTDVSAYVGIPRAPHGRDAQGCDCWGLVRLVLLEQRGIHLPSYAGDYTCDAERAELARKMAQRLDEGPWRPVNGRPQPFDMLVFRVAGEGAHVGLALDGAWMLHVHRVQSCIERHDRRPWATRHIATWRHEDVA